MAAEFVGEVTRLLAEMRAGGARAEGQLVELVFEELRQCARQLMSRERQGHTLQPTALLSEAFVRLLAKDELKDLSDRPRLVAVVIRAMREILVEHSRARKTQKRGGQLKRQVLDPDQLPLETQNQDVEALHEALGVLEQSHPRAAQVVTLRFFFGNTFPEVAEQLDLSQSMVERDWRFARAWLRQRLGPEGGVNDS
jgi:RNA polymerase sigma factor (TIGR02999 family)